MKIYNSLTGKKEPFQPLQPGKVSLYVCGNTVYDYCHIGHARSMIVFDVVVRYLRDQGYAVAYVRNITDIDDKIIKRALENHETIADLTHRFIEAQREDEKALKLLPPTHEPRATEYVDAMIALIEKLFAQDCAYLTEEGDVCFNVRRFKQYGQLSKHDLDKLRSGVRIERNDTKRDPLDFVLWKRSKPDEPRWPSPWGDGRPGWHTECVVMSTALLGQPFDIHGGGLDLKFPHHENEIAQAQVCEAQPFAKIWMHAGLLQVNKEKMSKSLGNFITIREALAKHAPETLRYLMISGHYRSPINYSEENMAQMQSALQHLYLALRGLPVDAGLEQAEGSTYRTAFNAAMEDDFNTPEALAVLFNLAREINRLREQNDLSKAAALGMVLRNLGQLLGILQEPPEAFLRGKMQTDEAAEIESLIQARNAARANKNWAEADRIRQKLQDLNIIIEDAANGTHWRRL